MRGNFYEFLYSPLSYIKSVCDEPLVVEVVVAEVGGVTYQVFEVKVQMCRSSFLGAPRVLFQSPRTPNTAGSVSPEHSKEMTVSRAEIAKKMGDRRMRPQPHLGRVNDEVIQMYYKDAIHKDA
jgi:hypothetical protein